MEETDRRELDRLRIAAVQQASIVDAALRTYESTPDPEEKSRRWKVYENKEAEKKRMDERLHQLEGLHVGEW